MTEPRNTVYGLSAGFAKELCIGAACEVCQSPERMDHRKASEDPVLDGTGIGIFSDASQDGTDTFV